MARPTLWHLTHHNNLPLIRQAKRLFPAAVVAPDYIGTVRRGRSVHRGEPVLRDQDLLHAACVELSHGWNMEDFLVALASRVFFWSGWPDRPVKPGRNAARRYAGTDVIIRVPFGEIATKYEPYFARCNSGATRMQNGKPVVRGPSAFLKGKECSYSPSEVVEVTFLGDVGLPSCTEVAHSLDGPWILLFGSLPNFSSSGRAEARRST